MHVTLSAIGGIPQSSAVHNFSLILVVNLTFFISGRQLFLS